MELTIFSGLLYKFYIYRQNYCMSNLIDRLSAVFDRSVDVCELILTQFCSSIVRNNKLFLHFPILLCTSSYLFRPTIFTVLNKPSPASMHRLSIS